MLFNTFQAAGRYAPRRADLSAYIEDGVAEGNGLAGGVCLDHAHHGVSGGGGDLGGCGGERGPVGGGYGRAVGQGGEAGGGRGGHVIALLALLRGVDHDGGLAGVAGRGDDVQGLHYALAAVVVDGVGLFVEDEAVVDEASLDEPAGDTGRIVVDLVLLELLGRGGGNGMGDDERRSGGQMGGWDLDYLAAVDLADDALFEQLLRLVAVLHERGILLEEVREAVGAERDAALVGDVVVAESLHALEEALIGVGGGEGGACIVAVRNGGVGESLEDIAVELRHHHLAQLAGERLARVGDHLGLELVALVDDEGEGAVAADRHGLHVAVEVVGGAVAAGAAAGVVVHGYDGDGVDLYDLVALKLVVVVQGEHGLGLAVKALVHIA